jgi:phenylacetate-CoA ligase
MSRYSAILRTLFLGPVLRRDNRASALRYRRFLRQSERWTRRQLLDYQWVQLQKLLRHAVETSPFYKRVFDERGLTLDSFKSPDDLVLLPMLTRDNLYDNMDELLSTKYDRSQLIQFSTGGTTGQRAELYRDQESHNFKLALQWRNEGWMGCTPCDKLAQIWPAPIDVHHPASWKEHIKNRYILRRQMYCIGTTLERELQDNHRRLVQFGPRFIKAFPSNLQTFAEYLKESGRSLNGIKGIQSSGEPLLPNQRRLFGEVFGCPVFDMYGSREVGNTSCECERHKGLHVAMETSIVEIVRDGRPLGFDEEGEILITDLTNYGVPMIRYRINDYGSLSARQCACGRESLLMSPGIGRVSDDVYAVDGTRHSGQLLETYLNGMGGPEVGQVQVIQRSLTEFIIRVTNKPKPTQENFDYIDKTMHEVIGQEINLTFEVVDHIPQEASGKVLFVKSELRRT